MGLHDLPFVVDAHREHFPDGFFVSLGPRFLTRYYRTFLDGGTLTVALVAEVDGERCGYLAGVLTAAVHRPVMLRYHGPGLLLAAVAALVTRPRVAVRFALTRGTRYARALRRDGFGRQMQAVRTSPPAVLSHVVVVEPERLAGVGRCLVTTFLHEADTAGCRSAQLVTDAGPGGAGTFYESLGWRWVGTTTNEGRTLRRYEISVRKGCSVSV